MVLPAYAGMILPELCARRLQRPRTPRICGDDSSCIVEEATQARVFPTIRGPDSVGYRVTLIYTMYPRIRGDEPWQIFVRFSNQVFSAFTGVLLPKPHGEADAGVFLAYSGVFPGVYNH